jgi:hypothetical protein
LQSKKELPSPFECFVWQVVPFEQHKAPSQQRLPQATGVAPGQAHAPDAQTFGPEHAFPHVPQFALLVCVFAQAPAQFVSAAPQQMLSPAAATASFAHFGVGLMHAVPQVPQLAGSIERSAQLAPPQSVEDAVPAQVQLPLEQVDPGFAVAQDVPQVPQFAGSMRVFTQSGLPLPPQLEETAVSAQEHEPPVQVTVLTATPGAQHAFPQAPQSLGSLWRSTHAPQQVCPARQITPQPPQFEGSRVGSRHEPPHSISGWTQVGLAWQPATPASATTRARSEARRIMPHDAVRRTLRPTDPSDVSPRRVADERRRRPC